MSNINGVRGSSGAPAVQLTEDQILACLVETECLGSVALSYDTGPYEVTRPSTHATRLVRSIERACATNVAPQLTCVQIADCVTELSPYPLELTQVPAEQLIAFVRAIERIKDPQQKEATASMAPRTHMSPQSNAECDSRSMFVARLENIQKNGNQWVTVTAVLALLNDCDTLAEASVKANTPDWREGLPCGAVFGC